MIAWVTTNYGWLLFWLACFVLGWKWPASGRIAGIILFGVPCLVLGYIFGFMQAGFVTGYGLYLRYGTNNKTSS